MSHSKRGNPLLTISLCNHHTHTHALLLILVTHPIPSRLTLSLFPTCLSVNNISSSVKYVCVVLSIALWLRPPVLSLRLFVHPTHFLFDFFWPLPSCVVCFGLLDLPPYIHSTKKTKHEWVYADQADCQSHQNSRRQSERGDFEGLGSIVKYAKAWTSYSYSYPLHRRANLSFLFSSWSCLSSPGGGKGGMHSAGWKENVFILPLPGRRGRTHEWICREGTGYC